MIKTVLSCGAAALLALGTPALAQDEVENEMLSEGQEELAKLLEGRVAGEPQRCVMTTPSRGFRIIDETALVYERGDTVWVNYTAHPGSLDDSDALLIRHFGGSAMQLCRLDNVTTFDRFNGFFTGAVFLEEFIPYRKVDDAG
jgi:hypothetical protein